MLNFQNIEKLLSLHIHFKGVLEKKHLKKAIVQVLFIE